MTEKEKILVELESIEDNLKIVRSNVNELRNKLNNAETNLIGLKLKQAELVENLRRLNIKLGID